MVFGLPLASTVRLLLTPFTQMTTASSAALQVATMRTSPVTSFVLVLTILSWALEPLMAKKTLSLVRAPRSHANFSPLPPQCDANRSSLASEEIRQVSATVIAASPASAATSPKSTRSVVTRLTATRFPMGAASLARSSTRLAGHRQEQQHRQWQSRAAPSSQRWSAPPLASRAMHR
jgi:hypothetical protein